MSIRVINADMRDALRELAADGVRFHSCVTDPPYHLTAGKKGGSGDASVTLANPYGRARITTGFMGQKWDGGDIAFQPDTWRAVYDVLLPGAHLLAFGGTRSYHRMACAVEDAGFEIRDCIMWMFGSGFPKSHDVSKGIDKAAGAEREVFGLNPNHRAVSGVGYEGVYAGGNTGAASVTSPATPEAVAWQGWGTALKPAWEPIVVARKPLIGTVAANVLAHGCGAMNIDACRVEAGEDHKANCSRSGVSGIWREHGSVPGVNTEASPLGRWPANMIHDSSPEVEEAFAAFGEKRSPAPYVRGAGSQTGTDTVYGEYASRAGKVNACFADSGSASRFFYSAKADKTDRAGSKHPTVKPTDLMRYLVQLVTPPGGTVLDPFAGSGSTGLAADQLGMNAVLIERDPEYAADIERKITSDAPLFAEVVRART